MEFIRNVTGHIKRIVMAIAKNKYFRRFAPLGAVAVIALVSLVMCMSGQENEPYVEPDPLPVISSTEPVTTTPPVQESEPVPPAVIDDPDPDPEPDLPVNPLTGIPTEEDISRHRPFAVMINNIKKANPQLGISKADIIYEILVEGGITRMLAIFQDVSDVGVIGSVRSSRLYYVDIAQSYDAFYVFAGGSPGAYNALSNRDITKFDGVAGPRSEIFYRDSHRRSTMGYEHSLCTTGERIMERMPNYDIRKEHEEGYVRALSFAEDGTPEGNAPAVDFSVKFGGSSKTTSFKYNKEDHLYYVSQYDKDYRDGNDDIQVAVTNILILRTSISGIPGDNAGRLDVKTTGQNTGYFICGGKYIEIDWSRDDLTSQFIYSLKDGSELILGQGKTYICIVSNSVDVILG